MKYSLLTLLFLNACQVSYAAPVDVTPPRQMSSPLQDKWRQHITIAAVAEDDTPIYVSTTGRVAADEEHTQRISAPVNGRVKAVMARLGDRVRVGQAVAELASSDVAQLQSDVKKAQQDLDVANKNWQRAQRLHGDGAVSDREVLQAYADYTKAKADLEQGQAHLSALGISPHDPSVRASLYSRVAGTVVERNISVGQEIRADAAEPLLTITDLTQVWVVADVYEQDLGQVQVGATVKVEVPAYPGKTFEGRVAYVGDMVDSGSRTVKVRCVMPNAERKLKPEMFAKVHIDEQRTEKSLYVPVQALLNEGAHTQVLIVHNDVVQTQTVRVGPALHGRQQVLSGLNVGDQLVTDGALFLHHAMQP